MLMLKFNKILLLLLSSTIILTRSTSYVWGMEQDREQVIPTIPHKFTTVKEMILLGENLTTLKGNSLGFERVIEVATAAPAFPAFTSTVNLSKSDLETYIFNRLFTLTSSYYNLADQLTSTNREKAIDYFTQATTHASSYLDQFNGAISQHDYINNRVLARHVILNKLMGESYCALSSLLGCTTKSVDSAQAAIVALQKSLQAATKLARTDKEKFRTVKTLVPRIKYFLIQAYCNQASFLTPQSQQQTALLNKARALKKELPRGSDLSHNAESIIQIAANNSKALHLTSDKKKTHFKN